MKKKRMLPAGLHRIAVVWDSAEMRSQTMLNGLYRRAEMEPGVSLRRFDMMASNFERAVLKPLIEWQPHGMIVRMEPGPEWRRLRERFPDMPMVAAAGVPAGLADTVVLGSAYMVTRMARDHLLSCGVKTLALWVPDKPAEAAAQIGGFRKVIPNGPALSQYLTIRELCAKPKGDALRTLNHWLRSMRWPVGVLTSYSFAAQYLSRACQLTGLRVPQDIQLIGCDEADVSLACKPPLTTVIPGADVVGEAVMETMLRHLSPHGPRPPASVLVESCTLVARGSTGTVEQPSRSIAKASLLIHEQATKGLTTAKLVRLSRLGRATFYRQFGNITGTTPARKLREQRIVAACRLLTHTKASISQISEKCGFSSSNYFAQVFRREIGLSPGEFRLQASSDPQP